VAGAGPEQAELDIVRKGSTVELRIHLINKADGLSASRAASPSACSPRR